MPDTAEWYEIVYFCLASAGWAAAVWNAREARRDLRLMNGAEGPLLALALTFYRQEIVRVAAQSLFLFAGATAVSTFRGETWPRVAVIAALIGATGLLAVQSVLAARARRKTLPREVR